jgi:DNA-binding GntR family transcriptional regulator
MLISSLLDLMHKSDQAPGARPRLSRPIVQAHEAIVDAIERRDAEEARRLTAEHLQHVHGHAIGARQQAIKLAS